MGAAIARPRTTAPARAASATRASEDDAGAEGQVLGPEHAEQADARRAHGEPEKAAQQGQDRRLRHHFPDHLWTARPPGLSHRELLHPVAGADEKEVRDVDGPR
jgi:hypothetical protein